METCGGKRHTQVSSLSCGMCATTRILHEEKPVGSRQNCLRSLPNSLTITPSLRHTQSGCVTETVMLAQKSQAECFLGKYNTSIKEITPSPGGVTTIAAGQACLHRTAVKPATSRQASSAVRQLPLYLLSCTSPTGQHLFSVLLVSLLLALGLANPPSAR